MEDASSTQTLTGSWADMLREVSAERDMLRREWGAVERALGPHASPGLTPSQNVAFLVSRMERIAVIADDLRLRLEEIQACLMRP
jgi:hypothetical protein